jgi:hypothetical protein
MRKACRQVADLAKVIMRAAEDGANGHCGSAEGAGDDSDDDHQGDRCAKAMRAERLSPVAIEHAFHNGAPDAQLIAAMPTCTLTLLFVYSELVSRKLWNSRFHRGKSTGTPVRTLATRHLHHPATDGWNVVAGASALAHRWALSREDLPRYPVDGACAFSRSTRVRLAVCLCVAWKFERSLSTHFPRQFYSAEPSLLSPHTHELAYVGYSFLLPHEQKEFGPWHPTNVAKIRELYEAMVALEVDLLNSVNVMTLLTRNVQVRAEDRIAELLAAHVVDAEAAMAMRSVVPFFTIASQDGRSMPPSEGALVCAAMLCMSVPTTVRAPVLHCHDTVCKRFTADERRDAFTLLDQATHVKGLAVATLSSTCYVEEEWVHYPFVCTDALKIALFMAHDVSKQR